MPIQSPISFPIGVSPGQAGKIINLASGQATLNTEAFTYEDLIGNFLDANFPALVVSSSTGTISYHSPNVDRVSLCEFPLRGYCISKAGISKAGFKTDANKKSGRHLSTHQCIQMCQTEEKSVSLEHTK